MKTVVYLVRHSDVTPRTNIKMISVHDDRQVFNEKSFLSIKGEKKAERLSKNLELKNIDAIYSSNYIRSLETAKYFAYENNTIINIDDRLNERRIGDITGIDGKEFHSKQVKDFNFKLKGGESLNQTKKRMIEAMKSILMFEDGNRIIIVSHSTAITCLLSAWCETGRNYDDEIILSYKGETIVDGHYTAPMVFKVVFDGLSVLSVEYLDI